MQILGTTLGVLLIDKSGRCPLLLVSINQRPVLLFLLFPLHLRVINWRTESLLLFAGICSWSVLGMCLHRIVILLAGSFFVSKWSF